MVAKAVPAMLGRVAPETLCRVRAIAAAEALGEVCRTRRPLCGAGLAAAPSTGGGGMRRGGTSHGGANASLWPRIATALGTGGLGEVWQACTTLREHRGDGHVAALVAHGLSGLAGARAGGRHQGDPGRGAAGQPRLERGGLGRGGDADRCRPGARRRAGHRRRPHPARPGRGADRRAGRARLRRPQRPGPRGAARCAERLCRRCGRLGSGAVPQPHGVAPPGGAV